MLVIVEPKRSQYTRCTGDNGGVLEGCDEYPATFAASGDYLNVQVTGHSASLKIATDHHFIDVASLADFVVISRGQCEETPPPISFDRHN